MWASDCLKNLASKPACVITKTAYLFILNLLNLIYFNFYCARLVYFSVEIFTHPKAAVTSAGVRY